MKTYRHLRGQDVWRARSISLRLWPGHGVGRYRARLHDAQALIAAGDDDVEFGRQLARQLRRWLILLPAGTGMATARATIKLLVGVPPSRSGVFSAGNGPAMRSPILGAAIDDIGSLQKFVRVSTRLTHMDPKAEYGALAVALATRCAARGTTIEPAWFAQQLTELLAGQPATEFLDRVARAVDMPGVTSRRLCSPKAWGWSAA